MYRIGIALDGVSPILIQIQIQIQMVSADFDFAIVLARVGVSLQAVRGAEVVSRCAGFP